MSACQAALDPPLFPATATATATATANPSLPATTEVVAPPPPPSSILITAEDYLGGIADLTGELMRLAIARVGSSLGSEQGMSEIRTLGTFVRDVKGGPSPPPRDVVFSLMMGVIERNRDGPVGTLRSVAKQEAHGSRSVARED